AYAVFRDVPKYARVDSIILTGMGDAELKLGRIEAAQQDYADAYAARVHADGATSFGLTPSLHGLGAAALALGHYADAETRFRAVLAQGEHALPLAHPRMNAAWYGLALARLGQGDAEDAFAYAQTAAAHQQQLLAQIAGRFVERDSLRYRELLV